MQSTISNVLHSGQCVTILRSENIVYRNWRRDHPMAVEQKDSKYSSLQNHVRIFCFIRLIHDIMYHGIFHYEFLH